MSSGLSIPRNMETTVSQKAIGILSSLFFYFPPARVSRIKMHLNHFQQVSIVCVINRDKRDDVNCAHGKMVVSGVRTICTWIALENMLLVFIIIIIISVIVVVSVVVVVVRVVDGHNSNNNKLLCCPVDAASTNASSTPLSLVLVVLLLWYSVGCMWKPTPSKETMKEI